MAPQVCAEYVSVEIGSYLRKVNDVPDSFLIGTEDPISVSQKFSQKFHDFPKSYREW